LLRLFASSGKFGVVPAPRGPARLQTLAVQLMTGFRRRQVLAKLLNPSQDVFAAGARIGPLVGEPKGFALKVGLPRAMILDG
jgi:hypothetical protein